MASSGADIDHVQAGYWFCGPHSLPVPEIHSELFTHLYAGFAVVDKNTGGVTFPRAYEEQFQNFTSTVQNRSPQVQTLLSIGGEGSDISSVARDANKRARFIKDSIALARNFDFVGLDLCWLYPSPSDEDTDLDSFLKEWRDAVKKDADDRKSDQLLLTAAVFYDPKIPAAGGNSFLYPCKAIADKLDWINVLAIDFYTPSNSSGETGPVHAWLNPTDPNRCGNAGIENWINNGVPTKQLVLGLPFYGYEWILDQDSHDFGFFAPAHPAKIFPIHYRNIQQIDPTYDSTYVATYTHNKQMIWIGYDNECSISEKVKEASGNTNLGGYFAWHVGYDDTNWTLSTAAKNAWVPPAGANP